MLGTGTYTFEFDLAILVAFTAHLVRLVYFHLVE